MIVGMKPTLKLLAAIALPLFAYSCGESQASVAGTYVLDSAAMDEAAKKMKAEIDGMSEDEKKAMGPMAAMLPMMAEAMKAMKMEMTFKDDGTCVGSMTMKMMGMDKTTTLEGTWKLEGEKITMTPTKEDGGPPKDATPKTGTFKDGKIFLKDKLGGGDKEVEMVLVRKKS